jgi:hypothetical protein
MSIDFKIYTNDTLWDENGIVKELTVNKLSQKDSTICRKNVASRLSDYLENNNIGMKEETLKGLFGVSRSSIYKAIDNNPKLSYTVLEKIYIRLMNLGALNY